MQFWLWSLLFHKAVKILEQKIFWGAFCNISSRNWTWNCKFSKNVRVFSRFLDVLFYSCNKQNRQILFDLSVPIYLLWEIWSHELRGKQLQALAWICGIYMCKKVKERLGRNLCLSRRAFSCTRNLRIETYRSCMRLVNTAVHCTAAKYIIAILTTSSPPYHDVI